MIRQISFKRKSLRFEYQISNTNRENRNQKDKKYLKVSALLIVFDFLWNSWQLSGDRVFSAEISF